MAVVWPRKLFFRAKDLFWGKAISPEKEGQEVWEECATSKLPPVEELWRAWSGIRGFFRLLPNR